MSLPGARHSSGTLVILSEAKDLMPIASGDEVLRFAQDDRRERHWSGALPAMSVLA
jgi:hypothetical protein